MFCSLHCKTIYVEVSKEFYEQEPLCTACCKYANDRIFANNRLLYWPVKPVDDEQAGRLMFCIHYHDRLIQCSHCNCIREQQRAHCIHIMYYSDVLSKACKNCNVRRTRRVCFGLCYLKYFENLANHWPIFYSI